MIFRKRARLVVGACCAGLMVGLLGVLTEGAFAHGTAHAATPAEIVGVIAGKPSELAFKVTAPAKLTAGTFTFKVKNEGLAFHDFKICTTPVKNLKANSCVGTQTKLLHPGQTATLTVKLTKTGLYEYLCSVPGHAGAGMKGLLGIGVKVPKVVTPPATTTTTTAAPPPTTSAATTTAAVTTTASTTTTAAAGGGSGGNYGCPAGETVQQVSPVGDTDADNQGGADDGDGCI